MLWYLEWLIIAFPLFAAAVNGALGTRLPRRVQRAVSLGALVGALLVTLPFFAGHAMRPDTVGRSVAIPWFKVWTGQRFIKGPLALRLDALSTLLLLTVLIAELALRLSATQKQGDRVCPPVQATVQVAALALALLADNLWCFFGAWALLGRDARPCALRRRARTLSSIHLIGFFALLLAACVWSRYAISLSYTHLEALTSVASIEGTARAALSGGTLLAFVAIMAYAGQLPFQGTFYRGYHPSLIAIYLAGRLYPFLPSVPVVARALSWWAILSALFLAGAALIEPNPQRAMRLFLASATGCCLLAVVQGTLLSVFAFLPLAIWLKVSLYVASMPTDSALPKAGARPGARIARGLGLASFTSVPLLPGFAFHSSLLATTFAGSAALGVLTAATVALIGASAARTVHTYGPISIWRRVCPDRGVHAYRLDQPCLSSAPLGTHRAGTEPADRTARLGLVVTRRWAWRAWMGRWHRARPPGANMGEARGGSGGSVARSIGYAQSRHGAGEQPGHSR